MSHPYIYPSQVLVYTLINQKNNTRWNPTDAVLKNVRPDTTSSDFRNTLVDLVGVEDEGVSGSVTVRYRRVDLGVIFSRCTLVVPFSGQTSTLECVESINSQYGTKFNSEDIELEYFNPNVLPLTVTLKAKATSPAYLGEVSLQLVKETASLSTGMSTLVVRPFSYPTGQSLKGQGLLYLRPYSFDVYWNFLKGLVVGNLSVADSATLLNLINGKLASSQEWVLDAAPAVRNLNSGLTANPRITVTYAGPPTLAYTHRINVDRILVLQLSDALCTGFAGILVVHFNDPSVDLDEAIVNKDIGKVPL